MPSEQKPSRLIIGWREWVSLPSIGIPCLKAKIDTGAKTSSIHAFSVDVFSDRGQPRVHFFVHPLQARRDTVVECFADLKDRRMVSDSGGHREKRYVIEIPIIVGTIEFPIEITLANRDTMSFRMLFGRSAMVNMLVDPSKSYLLGRPKPPQNARKKK